MTNLRQARRSWTLKTLFIVEIVLAHLLYNDATRRE